MNRAAVHGHVQGLRVSYVLIALGELPRSGIAGSLGKAVFVRGAAKTWVFTAAAPFLTAPSLSFS